MRVGAGERKERRQVHVSDAFAVFASTGQPATIELDRVALFATDHRYTRRHCS